MRWRNLESDYLQGPSVPTTCGVIAARAELDAGKVIVEYTVVHCAPSMAFAYFHSGMKAPVSKVDRTQNSSNLGHEPPKISALGWQTSWEGSPF